MRLTWLLMILLWSPQYSTSQDSGTYCDVLCAPGSMVDSSQDCPPITSSCDCTCSCSDDGDNGGYGDGGGGYDGYRRVGGSPNSRGSDYGYNSSYDDDGGDYDDDGRGLVPAPSPSGSGGKDVDGYYGGGGGMDGFGHSNVRQTYDCCCSTCTSPQVSCALCDAGEFSDTFGADICISCDAGSYSDEGWPYVNKMVIY